MKRAHRDIKRFLAQKASLFGTCATSDVWLLTKPSHIHVYLDTDGASSGKKCDNCTNVQTARSQRTYGIPNSG